jgi:hypothetical protein
MRDAKKFLNRIFNSPLIFAVFTFTMIYLDLTMTLFHLVAFGVELEGNAVWRRALETKNKQEYDILVVRKYVMNILVISSFYLVSRHEYFERTKARKPLIAIYWAGAIFSSIGFISWL